MLYHIVIKRKKGNETVDEYKKDLSKDDLLERFIGPYEHGNSIALNGSIIKLSDIERISICASEDKFQSLVDMVKEEDAAGITNALLKMLPLNYRAFLKGKAATDDFIKFAPGYKKESLPPHKSKSSSNHDLTKVFIVHGHDNNAKTTVARLIERLGFKAVILHEQISSGKTIIEKIEQFTNVGFAVVLYTPDDVGNVKGSSESPRSRARQNVIFEHGYLIGKLGRDRVTALVDDGIELPNDISGVVYTKMDKAEAWRFTLAQELKHAGYDIDLNKLFEQ